MKSFLKMFFASFFAFIVGGVILVFLTIGIITAIFSSSSKDDKVVVKENSVLVLDLSNVVVEQGKKSSPLNLEGIPGVNNVKKVGLNQIIRSIKKAKTDENIKGIYIKALGVNNGWATSKSIRDALLDFKKSGKFIYSYSELFTEKNYYIASASDKIYLHPEGFFEWNGLNINLMFYKKVLEKVGVEPVVFRVGTYKSAVEPFIQEKMSDPNREQLQLLLDDFWSYYLKSVSKSRKISKPKLHAMADSLIFIDPSIAKKQKFVDKVAYKDILIKDLKKKLSLEKEDKLSDHLISIQKYDKVLPEDAGMEQKDSENKVAVIYANGEIIMGKGDDNVIGSESLVQEIRKAREDENIKAVVLRVNSPGGSALASDIIWREIILTKKVKPVVASFGDVAASGGYYISAACNKIVAQPNTITGSIGVFGLMFKTEKLMNEKIGLTFDQVSTNKYADFGNTNRTMEEYEKNKMQGNVNMIYSKFISVVQKGRKFKDSVSVDKIAQGRVWTGIQAKKIGLVDEFGGLDKAIKIAAKLAELGDDYTVEELPEPKDPLEQIFKQLLGGASLKVVLNDMKLKEEFDIYMKVKNIMKNDPKQVMMWMPSELQIN